MQITAKKMRGFAVVNVLGLLAGLLVTTVTAVTADASLPAGSLIVNGSFEQPALPDESFIHTPSIPGWTAAVSCGDGGIEVDNSDLGIGVPYDGTQSVELNSQCASGVTQTVPTTPGASYSLSFAFGARPGSSAQQNQMQVSFGGSVVATVGPVTPAATLEWAVHQVVVTATGTSSVLTLKSTSPPPDGLGGELDSVTLVPRTLNVGTLQTVPGTNELSATACTSATTCVVVGSDFFGAGGSVVPFVNGAPGPVQYVAGTTAIVGVACATSSFCVAGGFGDTGVLVPITNGVAGAAQAVPDSLTFPRLVCPSPMTCLAFGIGLTPEPALRGVVVPITTGVVGTAQQVPGVFGFNGVACATPTVCVAVGVAPSFTEGVVVTITNGVAGTAQPVGGTQSLDAVACSSLTSCVAGGSSPGLGGAIVSITNGVAGAAQLPAGAGSVRSVACSGPTSCVGVGDPPSRPGDGIVVPVTNGGAGAVQKVPGTTRLDTVACGTSCLATAFQTRQNGPIDTDALPTPALVPISGGVAGSPQNLDGFGFLYRPACTSTCLTVGVKRTNYFDTGAGAFVSVAPGATPSISTVASGTTPAGGAASDTATVSGGFSPTGTVTFALYGPGDATCSTALSTVTTSVAAGGAASSGPVQVAAAGTYN